MRIKKDIFTVRSIASGFFMLSVALIATLPSSSLAGVPIKYVLLVVVIAFFIPLAAQLPRNLVAQFFMVGGGLLVYAVHGLSEFGRLAVGELVLALGAILLAMLVAHVLARRGLEARGLLTLFRLSVVLLGATKMGILSAYFLSPGYDAFQSGFMALYQQVTGSSFVSMPLPYGLVRIYLQHDLIAALFPLAVVALRSARDITVADRFFVMICLAIVMLGFSRFNMACYALSLAVFFWRDRRGVGFKIMFFLLVSGAVAVFYREAISFIELRFFSSANMASDEIRLDQSRALLELFQSAPVFGHGLGAYAETLIRSPAAPFSYEKQILSLLPKLGFVGASAVACYVVYLLWRLLYARHYYVATYFLVFLSASLFNPYLFSSNMILAYVLVFYFQGYASFSELSVGEIKING